MFALTLLYIGKISMSTDENLQRMKKTRGMGGGGGLAVFSGQISCYTYT